MVRTSSRFHVRRWQLRFFILMLAVMLAACGAQGLTEKDVIPLIREAEQIPELRPIYFPAIHRDDPLGKEIQRLIEEGYIRVSGWDMEVTERGRGLIGKPSWDAFRKLYSAHFYTHLWDVGKIREIVVDSESGSAMVTYELETRPTSYLSHLRQVDAEVIDRQVSAIEGKDVKRLRLKLWDQGWRVEGEPEKIAD